VRTLASKAKRRLELFEQLVELRVMNTCPGQQQQQQQQQHVCFRLLCPIIIHRLRSNEYQKHVQVQRTTVLQHIASNFSNRINEGKEIREKTEK